MSKPPTVSQGGVEARKIAISCINRIDEYEGYANIVLSNALKEVNADQRDRNLVAEIVYGATRMQRALDWVVDRYLMKSPPPALRASLRVGAYQLLYTRIPPHAAVSTTVEASSKKNKGVV
ncbi:MAG: transcription antitermination factor NusB, partial [Actinomycetota bacterium]|nr:transcription antitermination factor NusB [Actinomycetota bacterium]